MSETKSKFTGTDALILTLSLPFVIPTSAVVGGFVLTKLWLWFAVPIFSVQALTLLQAIGLSLLVGFFTVPCMKAAQSDTLSEYYGAWFARTFIINGFALLFGWIIHALM